MGSKQTLAAVGGGLAVLGALMVPTAAHAVLPPAAGIDALPFTTDSDPLGGAPTGGPGTTALNAAVRQRCNAGGQITGAQWYTLPPGDLGQVHARAGARFTGRSASVDSAVAWVDTASGAVLGCGVGPVRPTGTTAVVTYLDAADVAACLGGTDCRLEQTLFVNRTPGRAPNDRWQDAIPLGTATSVTADSSLADADGPDFVGDDTCVGNVAPDQHGTVWWSYTATRSGELPLSVEAATYGPPTSAPLFDAAVGLAKVTATGPVRVAPPVDAAGCQTAPHRVVAGQTYLVAAFMAHEHHYGGPRVTGGPLRLSVGAIGTPAAPTSIAATTAGTSATVTWQPPLRSGSTAVVTSYVVTRDGADGPRSVTLPASARSATLSGLQPGATYGLTVRAVNAAGTGVPAAVTRTVAPLLPAAPSGFTVTTDTAARTATVTWSAPWSAGGSPVTGYRVARDGTDSNGVGPWSTVTAATARSLTFRFLRPGQPYTLSVQAVSALGTGTAQTRSVTLTALPGAPTRFTLTQAPGTATITWAPPVSDGGSPVLGYRVARDGTDTAGVGPWSAVLPATARSLVFKRLDPRSSYVLTVQAVTAAGTGAAASGRTVATP